MTDNQNIQDPSIVGVGGLRGLNRSLSPSLQEIHKIAGIDPAAPPMSYEQQRVIDRFNHNPIENIGFVGINDSRLDRKITTEQELYNLENTRGKLQSTGSQLANALGQGVTTMGTTFLNGTVGTILGAIEASISGEFSDVWDNDFTRTLNSVNKWSEQAMPMHMTDYERESVWNQGFGNFVGNILLKPAGFVAGAALAGGAWAKGVTGAIKGISAAVGAGNNINIGSQAAQGLNAANQWMKAGNITSKIVGAVTSTAGEAAIEALNNSDEHYKLNVQNVDQYYGQLVQSKLIDIMDKVPDLDQETAIKLAVDEADREFNYNGALAKLEEDRVSTGNMDYLLNFPILMASNLWQFGRFYSRGFNANKRALNLIKKVDGNYVANTQNVAKVAGKIATNSFTEANEEMLQAVASEASAQKYGSEFNSFYGARIIPKAEEETQNLFKSLLSATADVYSDKERYFEGLSGALMGIGGNIRFEKPGLNTKTGKFSNGIYFEAAREANENNARANLLADQLNERVQSPEFTERYQGFIRHLGLENAKKIALEKDDQYAYENADHLQLLSDIIMFDKAGQLQDLVDTVDGIANISDSDIPTLREQTVNDSGTSPFDGMTNDEIKQNFKQRASDLKDTIKNYTTISRNLESIIGDTFQEKELEELTAYMSSVENMDSRFSDLHGKLREILSPYINSMQMSKLDEAKQEEINRLSSMLNSDPLSLLAHVISTGGTQFIDSLNEAANDLTHLLTQNKVLAKVIKEKIDHEKANGNDTTKLFEVLDQARDIIINNEEIKAKFPELKSSVEDMMKLAAARAAFIHKYTGFLKNPQLLREQLAKQEEDIADEAVKKSRSDLKNSLLNAKNTVEFDSILNNENDSEAKDAAVKELIEEGNELAKQYNDEFDYNNNINSELNKIEGYQKDDAKAFFKAFKKVNPGIGNFANPNIIASQTKEELGLNWMTDKQFDDAKRNVLNAQYIVNSLEQYANRLNSNYRKPETKLTPEEKEANKVDPVVTEENEILNGDISEQEMITTEEELSVQQQIVEGGVVDKYRLRNKDGKVIENYFYRPAISNVRPERFDPKLGGEERFNKLYDYLVSEGAFQYVDDGHLKVGDEIKFVINPAIDETAIWMVVGDRNSTNWQVVGSLNESGFAINATKGLSSLINKVRDEFKAANTTEAFMATPSVKVTELMVGKIFYQENENRPLIGIANTESPIFGVVKNGLLNTNNRLTSDQIELANILEGKEGHVYLLTKTINGKYRPIALKTVRFDSNGIEQIKDSALYQKQIRPKITKLAEVITEDDMRLALRNLSNDLYIGELQFDFTHPGGNNAIRIQRRGDRNKDNARLIYLTTESSTNDENDISWTKLEQRNTDDIFNELEEALNSFNVPVQINVKEINSSEYNEYLRNSNVLTSNTRNAKPTFNWFLTEYIDDNGNAVNYSNQGNKEVRPIKPNITEGAIVGEPIDIGILMEDGTIVNDNGKDITDTIKKPEETVQERKKPSVEEAKNKLNTLKRRITRPTIQPQEFVSSQEEHDDSLFTITPIEVEELPNGYSELYEKYHSRLANLEHGVKTKESNIEQRIIDTVSDMYADYSLGAPVDVSVAVENFLYDYGDGLYHEKPLSGLQLINKIRNFIQNEMPKSPYLKMTNEDISGTIKSFVVGNNNLLFENLDNKTKSALINKGWTETEFNKLSQAEKEHEINCLGY